MKTLILPFVALFLMSSQASAEFCFSDKTSYEARKADLPAILQKIPVILVTDSWTITGGFRVDFKGQDIRAQGVFYSMGEYTNSTTEVKKVCVHGSRIEILAESNYRIDVMGRNVRVTTADGSANFTVSDAQGLNAVLRKVNQKRDRYNR